MSNNGKWLTSLGLLLIAAALCLTAYNLYDSNRAGQEVLLAANALEEKISEASQDAPPASADSPEHDPDEKPSAASLPTLGAEVEYPDYVLNPDMEMPVEKVNGYDYIGILEIPVFELSVPIMSQWSYPHLKIAPCRYTGSVYKNDLILCAHNYPSHFGSIKNLLEGDQVIFTDVDGNTFRYKVAEVEILSPTAVEEMESGDWDLTLFTCTIGGQTRVTVRCVEDQP